MKLDKILEIWEQLDKGFEIKQKQLPALTKEEFVKLILPMETLSENIMVIKMLLGNELDSYTPEMFDKYIKLLGKVNRLYTVSQAGLISNGLSLEYTITNYKEDAENNSLANSQGDKVLEDFNSTLAYNTVLSGIYYDSPESTVKIFEKCRDYLIIRTEQDLLKLIHSASSDAPLFLNMAATILLYIYKEDSNVLTNKGPIVFLGSMFRDLDNFTKYKKFDKFILIKAGTSIPAPKYTAYECNNKKGVYLIKDDN